MTSKHGAMPQDAFTGPEIAPAQGVRHIAEAAQPRPARKAAPSMVVHPSGAPILSPPRPPVAAEAPAPAPRAKAAPKAAPRGPDATPGIIIKNSERGLRMVATPTAAGWEIWQEAYEQTNAVADPAIAHAAPQGGYWVWEGWSVDQYGDYLFDGEPVAPYWVPTLEASHTPMHYGVPIEREDDDE